MAVELPPRQSLRTVEGLGYTGARSRFHRRHRTRVYFGITGKAKVGDLYRLKDNGAQSSG